VGQANLEFQKTSSPDHFRSNAEKSPSGNPSARAFDSRLNVLPVRILGKALHKHQLVRCHGSPEFFMGWAMAELVEAEFVLVVQFVIQPNLQGEMVHG
jgi:hypothetical protein